MKALTWQGTRKVTVEDVPDPRLQHPTDAIVQIGKALSMTVVAEAVSSQTQLQMVRDLGCQLAQGNLISVPVPAAEATRLIEGSGSLIP